MGPLRDLGAGTTTKWEELQLKVYQGLETGFLIAVTGARGTGKTQLGVKTIRDWINCDLFGLARYVQMAEVFMAIKEAYKPDGPTERQQLAKFIKPRLLVIDEIHERSESEWENRLFSYMIDQRYGAMLDTILITNQVPAKFAESVGPSIYDRLTETGGLIVCDWPSYRGTQK